MQLHKQVHFGKSLRKRMISRKKVFLLRVSILQYLSCCLQKIRSSLESHESHETLNSEFFSFEPGGEKGRHRLCDRGNGPVGRPSLNSQRKLVQLSPKITSNYFFRSFTYTHIVPPLLLYSELFN